MKKEQKIQRNYHAIPVQKIKFEIMIRQKLVCFRSESLVSVHNFTSPMIENCIKNFLQQIGKYVWYISDISFIVITYDVYVCTNVSNYHLTYF